MPRGMMFLRLGMLTLQDEGARTDVRSLFSLGLGSVSFFALVNILPYDPVRSPETLPS